MPTKKAAAVVKASDLAPQAFNGQGTIDADKPDDLQYDLHHLAALDAHPVGLFILYTISHTHTHQIFFTYLDTYTPYYDFITFYVHTHTHTHKLTIYPSSHAPS